MKKCSVFSFQCLETGSRHLAGIGCRSPRRRRRLRESLCSRPAGAYGAWLWFLFLLLNTEYWPPNTAVADWPQLQCNPQRTGHTEEAIAGPAGPNAAWVRKDKAWIHGFQPDRLATVAQAVISNGRLFIGTKLGRMRAFDAKTGDILWTYQAGGMIPHTAGVENEKVFFGCMDGCVYALDANDGALLWKFDSDAHEPRPGFSTAVLLYDGKVLLGDRAGGFHALDMATGAELWRHDCGHPIFNSAAADDGTVFFADEGMRVHALDVKTGLLKWSSDRLYGISFKNYYPVVHKGKVLVNSFIAEFPRVALEWGDLTRWTPSEQVLKTYENEIRNGGIPAKLLEELDGLAKYLEENPWQQDFFVLDAATGKRAYVPACFSVNRMNGPTPPPAVDCDGYLILPFLYKGNRWARFDVEANRYIAVLDPDVAPRSPNDIGGSSDETVNVSGAGDTLFFIHDGSCHFSGTYNLRTRTPAYFGNDSNEKIFTENYLSHNAQPGGNAVAIAGGMFFHQGFSMLTAWKDRRPE